MDEMFYQIPEILLCHEFFLQQLQARVNEWHDKQKIGDIFVSSVRHCQDKPIITVHLKLSNAECGDNFLLQHQWHTQLHLYHLVCHFVALTTF